MRERFLTFRGSKRKVWGVALHSTEFDEGCGLPEHPEKIDFSIDYHLKNPRMARALENYRNFFERRFPNYDFGFQGQKGIMAPIHPYLITIELFNYPNYCKVEEAEGIIRNFLLYLVEKY